MLQNPNFVLREICGKALLMPIRRNDVGNEPIHLNEMATVVWKNAGNCTSLDELLQSVADLYNLTQDSAEYSAVSQFVDQLCELRLISERAFSGQEEG